MARITIIARIEFEIPEGAEHETARATAIEALQSMADEGVLLTHMPDDRGDEIRFADVRVSDRAIRID